MRCKWVQPVLAGLGRLNLPLPVRTLIMIDAKSQEWTFCTIDVPPRSVTKSIRRALRQQFQRRFAYVRDRADGRYETLGMV